MLPSLEKLFSVSDKMLRVISYVFEKLEEVTPLMLQKLLYFIETKEKIKITYFKKNQKKSGGDYLTTIQRIKKIDSIYKTITLQNGQIIKMEDIYEIEQ